MGLQPTTLRSRVACSADRARQIPLKMILLITSAKSLLGYKVTFRDSGD